MADMTIASTSVAGILSEAPFGGRGAAAELSQRTATAVRRARRWAVPLALVLASAAALGGAQLADQALQRERAAQVARNVALDETLRTVQLIDARNAVLVADVKEQIARQLTELESTAGFLK